MAKKGNSLACQQARLLLLLAIIGFLAVAVIATKLNKMKLPDYRTLCSPFLLTDKPISLARTAVFSWFTSSHIITPSVCKRPCLHIAKKCTNTSLLPYLRALFLFLLPASLLYDRFCQNYIGSELSTVSKLALV
jgi:hypothetical protein